MNRLQFLIPLILLQAGTLSLFADSNNRPNIIFLMTDDQRWDNMGCCGRDEFKTPNIDQLASQGVIFDQAFKTVAICMKHVSDGSKLLGRCAALLMISSPPAIGECMNNAMPHDLTVTQAVGQSPTTSRVNKHQDDPKPARSEFEMETFHRFTSHILSRPVSRGSLEPYGFVTKTIHGRVIDHLGKPVSDAKVAFVERIGFSGQCYDENFDLTDSTGQFVVVGDLDRTRIVIQNQAAQVWTQEIKPDESSVVINWPVPATCKITIDAPLRKDAGTVSVNSASYRGGMSSVRVRAQLNETGEATVTGLLPGSYRVSIARAVALGETTEEAEIEVGSFSIAAGESLTLNCARIGNRRIVGKLDAPNKTPRVLKVTRQKSSYSDVVGPVELVTVKNDGSFETDPLPPGNYRLMFLGPKPEERPKNMRAGFGRAGPVRSVISKRIRIPETNEPFQFEFDPVDTQTVAGFIERTFDTDGQLNVSWSYADVQVAQVAGHSEREAVVKELIRILKDENSPQDWDHLVHRLLASMTDSAEVVDALLGEIAHSPESRQNLIWSLSRSTVSLGQLADGIQKYRHDSDAQMRRCVYSSLLQFVQRDKSLQEKIEPWLVEGLSDPFDGVREAIVPVLGRINATSALPKLHEARKDNNFKVRVFAAYAIGQITGDQTAAIKAMTVRLRSHHLAGQNEAAYLLANFDEFPEITIDALLAKVKFDEKRNYRDGVNSTKHMIKRSAIRTLNKVSPESLPENLRSAPKK